MQIYFLICFRMINLYTANLRDFSFTIFTCDSRNNRKTDNQSGINKIITSLVIKNVGDIL